jgi:hypothetical protein
MCTGRRDDDLSVYGYLAAAGGVGPQGVGVSARGACLAVGDVVRQQRGIARGRVRERTVRTCFASGAPVVAAVRVAVAGVGATVLGAYTMRSLRRTRFRLYGKYLLRTKLRCRMTDGPRLDPPMALTRKGGPRVPCGRAILPVLVL